MGEGLDAENIAADIIAFQMELDNMVLDGPKYTEVTATPNSAAFGGQDLSSWMSSDILQRASHLERNTGKATKNIQASAELRQSISNLRLQRLILGFSAIAVLVAIISLLISMSH
jgi:hypothetical protein